jgi:hypothetical protein
MGRPPKKRAREDDTITSMDLGSSALVENLNREWSSADFVSDTLHLCPPVYLNRPRAEFDASPNPQDQLHRLQPIAATATPWPDFATTSAASAMLSMDLGYSAPEIMPSLDPQATPQCPCLSYLYLCLSTLSTLTSFPVSIQTINSLNTAARTAQSVIRCEICPRSFATGVQNVMMLGTLLSVTTDAWLRVSQADAEDLGRQIAPPPYQNAAAGDPQGAKTAWKRWLRQVVCHAVIGSYLGPDACPQSVVCDLTPDLLSLIREMEYRQRRWHADGRSQYALRKENRYSTCQSASSSSKGTSPDSMTYCTTDSSTECNLNRTLTEEKQGLDERDMLCLKVIGAAKSVVEQFDFQPSEYPKGVEPL